MCVCKYKSQGRHYFVMSRHLNHTSSASLYTVYQVTKMLLPTGIFFFPNFQAADVLTKPVYTLRHCVTMIQTTSVVVE